MWAWRCNCAQLPDVEGHFHGQCAEPIGAEQVPVLGCIIPRLRLEMFWTVCIGSIDSGTEEKCRFKKGRKAA